VSCCPLSPSPCVQTARANASSFTLTFATGRSVGIGAYLVRLGQRTIQRASSAPIILTGFKALNKRTYCRASVYAAMHSSILLKEGRVARPSPQCVQSLCVGGGATSNLRRGGFLDTAHVLFRTQPS
jgi:hypothetical protein